MKVFCSVFVMQNAVKECADKEAVFKRTSTIAQSLATKCDKNVSERRIDQLRDVKNRLLRCRDDADNRQKLLRSVQPTAKQLSAATTELNVWLQSAEDMLDSHRIDGDIGLVEKRLNTHKVCFLSMRCYWQRGEQLTCISHDYMLYSLWRFTCLDDAFNMAVELRYRTCYLEKALIYPELLRILSRSVGLTDGYSVHLYYS
jgi:hypothetical protein